MRERRRRAALLFAAGKRTQAEIARELDISRQSVSRWHEAWRLHERHWIGGAGRAGRRPKLDEEHLRRVGQALRQGAQAHGFGTALWTLPRMAAVIERVTGAVYHPGHVLSRSYHSSHIILVTSFRSCVEDPGGHEMEFAAALQTGARTQCGGAQALGGGAVAEHKKTPGGEKPGFSSKTKVESRSGRR
jgi:transposase